MIGMLIWLMKSLAWIPLPVLRKMGAVLGLILYAFASERRNVAEINLALCFPQWTADRRRKVLRKHFISFMQSILDRSWLWHASEQVLARRLSVSGDLREMLGKSNLILFVPHFVGLDAGGLSIAMQIAPRAGAFIFSKQKNPEIEKWERDGRQRLGNARAYYRHEGVRNIVSALRSGELLHLSPDMDFGPAESVFVNFFGVPAATLPSLSRFARLGRAQVAMAVTRMTPKGYRVELGAPWEHFPSDDVLLDTQRMNEELQALVLSMPEQYYWVHKRFKTRPPGSDPVY